MINRAIYLHNQICTLLLTAYESLQDHILNMSLLLSEFDRKKINLGEKQRIPSQ